MNVMGFDDGPFSHAHRGRVLLVGALCAGTRLDGVVSGHVRRDGGDAASRMIDLVRSSQFGDSIRAVMLQGIAVGGFNVVDVHELSRALDVPVLIVTRRPPDLDAVRRALFSEAPPGRPRVAGAERKWDLIVAAGPVEFLGPSRRALRRLAGARAYPAGSKGEQPVPRIYVQRIGLTVEAARKLIEATTLHGNIPEPVRIAHLIAGGIVVGRSRGRA